MRHRLSLFVPREATAIVADAFRAAEGLRAVRIRPTLRGHDMIVVTTRREPFAALENAMPDRRAFPIPFAKGQPAPRFSSRAVLDRQDMAEFVEYMDRR